MTVLKRTILVTGGAGFLGSHLCEHLVSREHMVYCVDNLYSSSLANITHLLDKPNFRFVNEDITNDFAAKLDDPNSIEVIYNLACPASPVHYQRDPVQTMRTSVLGIINCLELAKRNRAVLIHASTSEVYGDPTVHPQTEEYWGNVNPIGPRANYDEGKRAAETLCRDYRTQYKVDARIMRLFNVYGPRLARDDGRVVSNFILQALEDKSLTVYGDGSQTRSFLYVEDWLKAALAMFGLPQMGPINIGNPNEFTIKELAEKIILKTNGKSSISYHPLPKDDPRQRKPDITKAKTLLKWEPGIDLDRGLDLTIQFYKEQNNALRAR